MAKRARIVGKVTYREGDGMPIAIRPGPCEVEEADDSVTITWLDGDAAGSAAMPRSDFAVFLANGAVVLEE